MYRAPPSPPPYVPAPAYAWPEPPRVRRRWRWRLLRWLFILAVWTALAAGCLLLWFAWDLPRPEAALAAVRRPGLTLLDSGGHAFARFGDVVGAPVRLDQLPPALPLAVVAIEDRRFWTHWGLDLAGIARAAWVDASAGAVRQGGSTLTQQVAKNLFLSNARTFRRKVQEVLLTLWLEHSFSKREILEIWLNRVYLGSGAWGVDAAARLYFGVPAARLSLWQCAVLAGLPRAPSRLSPLADPEAAAARGREVLAAMVQTGAITPAQAQDAAARIAFAPPAAPAGWFAGWAAGQAEAVLPPGTDAVVRTMLDARLQARAQARLDALLDGPGVAARVGQGAVVALDAATGAVRAMVGGRGAGGGFNRAVAARRQPGSAFKPIVFLAALEAGVAPDARVLDAPITVGGWSPRDFDRQFRGAVSLDDALAHSLNTAAVRLLLRAGGPAAVIAVARRLGIAGPLPDNATLALGTGGVGVLELASAYAALFAGGMRAAPTALAGIEAGGRALPLAGAAPARVAEPALAAAVVRMMRAVVTRGSGQAASLPGRAVAGKTGTTQDSRDAWFVGAIGGTVIAVWLGNDDGRPMDGVTGSTLPARLFHDIAAAVPP